MSGKKTNRSHKASNSIKEFSPNKGSAKKGYAVNTMFLKAKKNSATIDSYAAGRSSDSNKVFFQSNLFKKLTGQVSRTMINDNSKGDESTLIKAANQYDSIDLPSRMSNAGANTINETR